MLEQWFAWLPPILQALEPILSKLQGISLWVLGFGALLLLAGLVGGGFKIQSVEIPRIGTVARALCGALGMISVSVFIAIPQETETFDLVGEVIFKDPPPPGDTVGIRLYRLDNPIEAIINDGKFEFRTPGSGLQAGTYRAEIYSDQGTLDDVTVFIAPKEPDQDQTLSLSQGPDGEFIHTTDNLVQHLVKLSKQLDWQYRVTAIQQLNHLAGVNTAVREDLLERMKRGGDDSRTAGLALAESCNTQNQDVRLFMQQIWKADHAQPYQRVSALASLLCDRDEAVTAKQALFELAKGTHAFFADYSQAATQGVPNLAAYYLALAGERRSCLLGVLLKGVESRYKVARDRSFEALSLFVGQQIVGRRPNEIRDWLGQNVPKMDDC